MTRLALGAYMLRKKKRRIKKAVLVLIPMVVLSAISLASIAYRPRASETTFAFERYYDEKENSYNQLEYDNIDKFAGDNTNMADSKYTDETVVITNHESVELDRDPESITVLVNKELSLPTNYVPKDLVVPNVKFSITYYDEKKLMRKEAAEALEDLFLAAEKDGYTLYGISAYRSYKRQYDIFTNNIKKKGFNHTLKYSAKPGYSEHQTGLAIDVSVKSIRNLLDSSFSNTPEGKWLDKNAHLYGYIIRYPEDKSSITGYSYEPWHIRYVGVSLATYLYENNLVLEEYYSFEPSIDFNNEISYDNLVDFGINIADVIERKPPVVEEPIEEVTEDEEDLKEEIEELEAPKDIIEVVEIKDNNKPKGDGKKGNDKKSSSKDSSKDNSVDLGVGMEDEAPLQNIEDGTSSDPPSSANKTPSITPTMPPSDNPTITPPVTPTPTISQTISPAPSDSSGSVTPTVTPSITPTP